MKLIIFKNMGALGEDDNGGSGVVGQVLELRDQDVGEFKTLTSDV